MLLAWELVSLPCCWGVKQFHASSTDMVRRILFYTYSVVSVGIGLFSLLLGVKQLQVSSTASVNRILIHILVQCG